MNYQIGEVVLYGTEGICTVLGTEEKRFGKEALMYYVLESKSKGSRIYVPFSNETLVNRIRKPLFENEMKELLASIDTIDELAWIENDRERKTANMACVANGSATELLMLMKTIQSRRMELESKGKRLYAHDDRSYREARALLVAEMTASFGITEEQASIMLFETWEPLGIAE
ncbi:MAG: hypothetical protein E7616_02210 [Ruminococcaceae bacterium]|nr:hypothetical protein [Oscillospiraceae bacterium]